jgi:hypothetical protein
MRNRFPCDQTPDVRHTLSRLEFCALTTKAAIAAAAAPAFALAQSSTPKPKMTICLTPGSIGVSANQTEAIDLAARHGFEAVEPFGNYLATL